MATALMRPHTVMGYTSPSVQYVDTDTKLGEEVLLPGFRQNLVKFCSKASPADQARCLELINSLDIGQALREDQQQQQGDCDVTNAVTPHPPTWPHRGGGVGAGKVGCQVKRPHRRPKTAMAAIERPAPNPLNPYMSTYDRDYAPNQSSPARAERPSSVQGFHASYELGGPIGSTTYNNEYCMKQERKAQPIRTGSSSGNRRNNPHPFESFMVWKLPQRTLQEQPYSEWATELTDEVMDRVCRGKLMSTYQQDYLGIPRGQQQVKEAFGDKEDWRSRVPYTLDSSMRHSYQLPECKKELAGNTKRYVCNKLKHEPALGVVPTVSTRQMHIKTRTTYDREYQDPIPPRVTDVRDLSKAVGAQALARQYQAASNTEKPRLRGLMDAMNVKPPTSPSSRPPSDASIRTSRRYKATPPTTCVAGPVNPSMSANSPLCVN